MRSPRCHAATDKSARLIVSRIPVTQVRNLFPLSVQRDRVTDAARLSLPLLLSVRIGVCATPPPTPQQSLLARSVALQWYWTSGGRERFAGSPTRRSSTEDLETGFHNVQGSADSVFCRPLVPAGEHRIGRNWSAIQHSQIHEGAASTIGWPTRTAISPAAYCRPGHPATPTPSPRCLNPNPRAAPRQVPSAPSARDRPHQVPACPIAQLPKSLQ